MVYRVILILKERKNTSMEIIKYEGTPEGKICATQLKDLLEELDLFTQNGGGNKYMVEKDIG